VTWSRRQRFSIVAFDMLKPAGRRTRPTRHRGLGRLVCLSLLGLAGGCRESAGPAKLSGEPASPSSLAAFLDLAGHNVEPFQVHRFKAIVFLFTSADCPISNRYAPEVRRLHDQFTPRGVAFWLVYAGTNTPVETLRKHLREFGYPCPALRDPELSLARRASVRVTPEAAVFLPDGRLAYHGRIDDRFADLSVERPAPTRLDLKIALEEILAGKPVSQTNRNAVGCLIRGLP